MNKETLLNGLLTLGGSVKGSDATGAFGAAKKLVLFSHASYEIKTCELVAKGSVLDYELLEDQPWFDGTSISCEYFEGFGSERDMVYSAKYALKQCDFSGSCKVFINGEEFTDWMSWPEAKIEERDWCTVKSRPGNGCIYIRKNGIYSFYRYTSSKKEAIIELKPPSRECLTQSRESLRDPYKSLLDSLASEMSVDECSFGMPGVREFVYLGKQKFVSFISDLRNSSKEVFDIVESSGGYNKVCYEFSNAQKAQIIEQISQLNNSKIVQGELKRVYQELCEELQESFVVDLADSEYQTVPDKYAPKTMQKRYLFLAQLWKATIIEILSLYKYDLEFQVGFTLNKQAKALYQRKKGEPIRLFINPDSFDFSKSYDERFWALFVSAIEEVSHAVAYCESYTESHGETYNSHKNNILTKVLPSISWRTVWKNAQITAL